MTLLRADIFASWDFALDGQGYLCEPEEPNPFIINAPDIVVERSSLDPSLEQNWLDTLAWSGNRSWHEGMGQVRADMPPRFQIDPSGASSPYKALRCKGVDITTRGQLTLLKATSQGISMTNQAPTAPIKIGTTDAFAYVLNGTALWRFDQSVGVSILVSQNTGSAQNALDITTDGGIVYVACGTDGIYRALTPATTQINAMDATTGWTIIQGSGTLTVDTADRKEGTGSLKLVSGGTTQQIRLTFGSAQDYSAVDTFTFWAKMDGAVAVLANDIHMETTTSTAYFRYNGSAAFVTQGAGWVQFSVPRTSFTTGAGSPAWNNINSVSFTFANGALSETFHFDDLERVVAGNFAAWSSADTRVIGWANGRVYGAGVKSGTQWRFFEAAAAGASVERAAAETIPDGWVITDIAELGGLVYFAGYRGGKGQVWSYDGSNAPKVACPVDALGNGNIPLSLTPFSGAGMLIGCRRLTGTASGGLGVVYRGFPDAAGSLRVERVMIHGVDDGRDYGIRCGTAYGDYTYFGMSYGDEPTGENFLVDQTKRSGLGLYWPETGGWSRSYLTPTGADVSGIVEDVAVFKGRRMFTIGGVGLFIEQSTYEPEGGAQSSRIDLNVSADKIWLAQESVYSNPEALASPVNHAYSLDGTTWANDTGAADSTVKRLRTSFATLGLKSPNIYGRVRLKTTNATQTPVLDTTAIGGWPASKPLFVFIPTIRAYPHQEDRAGVRIDQRDNGYTILARLLALQQAQTIVDLQPPWWTLSGISYKVRVTDVQTPGPWATSGERQGGAIKFSLKVVP